MTVTVLNEAMVFALKAHGGQKYGRKPYHVHLLDVIQVLRRFHDWDELDQDLINAAWLHDVVEDTEVTLAQVRAQFGDRVAAMVDAVTNGKDENGRETSERTYPLIRDTPGAIKVKLADRIANLEQTISYDRVGRIPGKFFRNYLKRKVDFEKELRGRTVSESVIVDALWLRLDILFELGKKRYPG